MTDDASPPVNDIVLEGADDGLCLRFVNTVAWRKAKTPEERLPSAPAVLDWCLGAGLLENEAVSELKRRWEERPCEAIAFHHRVLALREAVYAIFRSRILSEPVPVDALRVFNEILAASPVRRWLAPSGDALGWSVGSPRSDFPALLAPIIWSAADLMSGPRVLRVRQCEDHKGCGWLFLDESRAGTRRWCSMGECGNRAKARRHYLRTKHPDVGSTSGTAPDRG
jgi:predicted RNA-binding Zn ribbon-like protein